jgi:cytochrome c-type biogenesis protein CcsB
MTDILLSAASLLYAGSWAGFWWHMARVRPTVLQWAVRVLTAGVVVHGLGLVVRLVGSNIPPATSGLEGLSLLSLLIAVTFLVFAKAYPVEAMGAFAAPLVSLNLTASLLFAPNHDTVPEALKTGYFVMHITLAFLGNAFLAIAAVASGAYVVQERNLRLKKLATGRLLPNLNVTDHLAYRSVTLGFLFMTAGIVSGVVYSKHAWHSYWSWDPRQTWSLCTWFAYAALLHARLTSGWRGRRWAWLTVCAFVLVGTASVVLDVFKLGRHSGNYDARPVAVEPQP